MPTRQLEARMWAQAVAAMERAERLHRQFFHHGSPHWQAPIDVFETDRGLIILVALPGVEHDDITVALNAGVLIVRGQRPPRWPSPLRPESQARDLAVHGRWRLSHGELRSQARVD